LISSSLLALAPAQVFTCKTQQATPVENGIRERATLGNKALRGFVHESTCLCLLSARWLSSLISHHNIHHA